MVVWPPFGTGGRSFDPRLGQTKKMVVKPACLDAQGCEVSITTDWLRCQITWTSCMTALLDVQGCEVSITTDWLRCQIT